MLPTDQSPLQNPNQVPSLWQRTTTRRFLCWLFRWQTLRGFLLAGAGLITFVALFYAVENFRGKRAWTRHKQAMIAQGEVLDLAALVPPPVADERNLAMAPLLRPIFQFTRTDRGLRWTDSNGYHRVRSIYAETHGGHRKSELAIGSLERGTFADLKTCRQFYLGNTNYPQPTASGTAAADVLTALGKFDAELRELQEAAAVRPECRFPVDYTTEPPAAILLPHLASLKAIAGVVQLRAVARLEQKQIPEAWADLQLGLTLADALQQEPVLISFLVRVAILTIHLQVAREGLLRHAWTDAQLMELEKRLGAIDLLADTQRAIRAERTFGLGCLDYARRNPYTFDAVSWMSEDEARNGPFNTLIWTIPRGWFYQNMVTLSSLFQDHSLPGVDVQAGRVLADPTDPVDDLMNRMKTSPYGFMAGMFYPSLSGARMRIAQNQTYVDAARLACALERHRTAQGKLPDKLEALAPPFPGKVPHDRITGQPLHYRLNPDGSYLIYSVGKNQTDDGGENSWSVRQSGAKDTGQDDWTWRMPP